MRVMKLARPSIKALAATGASAAVIASGSAAYAIYAATAAPTASPASAAAASPPPAQLTATGAKANASTGAKAKARAAARRARGGLVIGELTSVSPSGGAASQGTISVLVPDGQTVSANLVKRTRVLAYQGPGTKPTTETLSQLRQNEMVAVRIVRRPAAGSGTGSAPAASGTASAGPNALTLTAASPGTASGTAYAALIVDLGYTAGS